MANLLFLTHHSTPTLAQKICEKCVGIDLSVFTSRPIHIKWISQEDWKKNSNAWAIFNLPVKVEVLWKGHTKICKITNLDLSYVVRVNWNIQWRFWKIVWPSQNIWTLNSTANGHKFLFLIVFAKHIGVWSDVDYYSNFCHSFFILIYFLV